jgi:hypothetical protein
VFRKRSAFAGCALAALAAGVGAVNAPAASAAPSSAESIAADGYFNAYYDLNLRSVCHRWKGNEPEWAYYGCANEVQSVWNNGYPGSYDDVLVFWDSDYGGAWRGIYNGTVINDLRPYTFDWSNGLPGNGETTWLNIASHSWTNLP